MKFDEVLEFDDAKYGQNIADHTFPETDDLDGKGETNE